MSETEIRTALLRYAEAWRAGDLQALRSCYHDDFTLYYAGSNPLSGTHRGKSAALQTLAEVSRRTGRKLVEIVDVMAGARRGTIMARERFQKGDLVAELDRLLVYTVRDGLLAECWVYDFDQALVDRFLAD